MWRLAAAVARYLPAEAAHRAAVQTLRYNLGPRAQIPDLPVSVAGLSFANPLGLAAGFDKDAACFDGAMRLGFGHVEVGTITPLPQPGNPRPRVFRLRQDAAVINRYGFNGKGMEAAARNLAKKATRRGVLGVNVGANKTSKDPIRDYHEAVARLAGFADYEIGRPQQDQEVSVAAQHGRRARRFERERRVAAEVIHCPQHSRSQNQSHAIVD